MLRVIPSNEILRDTWLQSLRRGSFHTHFFSTRGRSRHGLKRHLPSVTTWNQRARNKLMGLLIVSF